MYKTLAFALLLASCRQGATVDLEKEKKEILRIQAQQRQNHFKKNAAGMVDASSDSFYVIDGGSIHRPKREDQLKSFADYFNAVEFIRWDDKREPLIRFSNDASVAYVAVEKLVVLKTKDAAGTDIIDTTHFAWMSVYRKQNGRWALDAIASTDRR